jgi:ABC-type multidrug transport system permease subunit
MNIKSINSQLINVNTQILDKINQGKPIFETEYKLRSEKAQALIDNYLNLLQQKEKIYETIAKQNTLDQTQMEGNIKINQNYYSFLLLLVLSIVFIVILYFLSKSKNNVTSSLTGFLNPSGNTST